MGSSFHFSRLLVNAFCIFYLFCPSSIVEGRDFARRNGQWLIADGRDIATWEDKWLWSKESLEAFKQPQGSTLQDLLDAENRKWNVQKVRQLIPPPMAVKEYAQSDLVNPTTTQDSTRNIKPDAYWKCPIPGVLKCNIDVAWHGSLIPGAIAFVVRDSARRLLTGHAKKVPASSPFVAEALARREAVLATYNFNWEKVVLESDCFLLIEACRKERVLAEIKGIVEDILTVADGFLRCGFTWVQRQANTVAHLLAQNAYAGSLPVNWLASQPDWLRHALIMDCSVCPTSSLGTTLQAAHPATPLQCLASRL
ncbi:Ribonuclease H-like superfamily [Sesbania bispinosa]|nr:Ribonuclease H-like superfamily [Sesbania bispinosa]